MGEERLSCKLCSPTIRTVVACGSPEERVVDRVCCAPCRAGRHTRCTYDPENRSDREECMCNCSTCPACGKPHYWFHWAKAKEVDTLVCVTCHRLPVEILSAKMFVTRMAAAP